MQVTKNIIFLLLGVLVWTGCKQAAKETISDPLVYDSKIIGEMMHVNRELFHLLEEMAAADPQRIADQYARTQQQIEESLVNTQQLTAFKKSTEYRDSALALLEFHKDAMTKQYKRIVDISVLPKPSLEQEEERESLFEQMENVEEKLDTRFLDARKKFGTTNEIELPNDGLQM